MFNLGTDKITVIECASFGKVRLHVGKATGPTESKLDLVSDVLELEWNKHTVPLSVGG